MTINHPSFASTTIAFICASWHKEIVSNARQSFGEKLDQTGHTHISIEDFQVPGSLEIPLMCKKLAESGRYSLIVAAGLIVDGGIYRHDFVARTVIDGMMRVQLDCDIPVLSVVLTPHHFHESATHHEFFTDHFVIKGQEAAECCIETLNNLNQLALIDKNAA